ncbi:ClpP-like prohead protease/major capsid protein fusion protein [Microbulbifer variabilis]|uniref:ClpP-like prohead protease/major capsid protein fusion protein n=1 Tax=Microbulbifer variabilis TaxID=266805 RepID=UPI000367B5A7|nr:ClpP-like prohead protease/major capsid protein fusion protein [Microbulbifer variabilis]
MPKKSWYSITAAANNTEADIYLYDYIGYWGVTAKDFARDLKALGDVSKINLHINCPGGDVFDGTAIYNLLKDHKAEVETWIEGIAASMGSVIALAGGTVHIAENAYYMVHNPSAGVRGDERALEKTKSLLAKVKATMKSLYSSRTGMSDEEISQVMDDETWYTGAEAVEAGFATDTTAAMEMAASFSADHLNQFKNTPQAISTLVMQGPTEFRFPSAVADNPPQTKEAQAMPKTTSTTPAATAATEVTPEMKAQIAADAKAQFAADEKKRKDTIKAVFKGFDAHSTVMQSCLDDMDCTAEKAKDQLLTALGSQTPTPVQSYSLVVQEGEGIKRMKADAENAIAMRALGEKRTEGNELTGYTMMEIARILMQAHGQNLAGLDKMGIVAAAFTHSSGDFATVLGNIANKSMLKGYSEAAEVFPQFTATGNLSDFKIATRTDLGTFPSLRQVAPGAEFKYVSLGERAETAALATYGEMFSINRQAIINDDLGAFTRIPQKMGLAAVRTVGDLVFSILLNNPQMADGKALFHADHGNLATKSGINTASIDAARVLMGKQKDGTAFLNIRPKFLLCDIADEGAAKVALESEFEVGASEKSNTVPNSVRNIASVISDGRLSGHNGWYLNADPVAHDTIEVLYLDGQQAPVLEQQNGWNIDGVEFKVRLDAAAKAWDAKGMVKTPKN